MLKVIELLIDEALSADTRIESVALVDQPAVEVDFVYFSKQAFYRAPEYVSERACQAIRENEQRGNPAGTQVGKIRAQQLCQRQEISLETVKRMKSYLERAKTYDTGNWDDNGTISYGLWGGNSNAENDALTWVNKILQQEENKQDFDYDVSALPSYEQYPTGDTKNDMLIKPVLFVDVKAGETEEEYVSRCMGSSEMISEFPDEAQRAAVCYSTYERKEGFLYENPCQPGYVAWGLKDKDGRQVPNCVEMSMSMDLDIFGFKPSYFHICPMAISLFNHLMTMEVDAEDMGMIRSAALQADKVFEIESKVLDRGSSTPQDLTQAILLVDDFKDLMREIDEELGMSHNVDFMDGHIQVIEDHLVGSEEFADYPWNECIQDQLNRGYSQEVAEKICGKIKAENASKQEFKLMGYIDGVPYFSSQEEAMEYGRQTYGCEGAFETEDNDGNKVFTSCDMSDDMEDNGIELEDLLMEGWVIEDYKPVDMSKVVETFKKKVGEKTQEDFYRIVTKPNDESFLDYGGKKVRFVYMTGMGPKIIQTSRQFCRRMLGQVQYVFRFEDIMNLNIQITGEDFDRKIIPRPIGTDPEIFQWKGGANCRHYWAELTFGVPDPNNEGYNKPIQNKADRELNRAELVVPATGQAGLVNPKAQTGRGNRDGAFASQTDELIPTGFIQGLAVFADKVDAEDFSFMNGCGGIVEEVDYMGKKMFQSCSYSMKAEMGQKFSADDEKRMLYSPLMIPNKLIPRLDEVTGEKYYVKFSPETIEKMRNKFMIEQRLRETNYEHTDKKFSDMVMIETWIVDGDKDKAYDLGFTKTEVPFGTWMAGYKFLDTPEGDDLWNNYVKKGKVSGLSVEGQFIMNFSRVKNEDYLLEQIINIIKDIEA